MQHRNRKITLGCGTQYALWQIEHAGLSFLPCAIKPGQKSEKSEQESTPLFPYSGLWGEREQVTLSDYKDAPDFDRLMRSMDGVQLMTGAPTHRIKDDVPYDELDNIKSFFYLVDIDTEVRLIQKYREHHKRIFNLYREGCEGTPCITRTKSGGERYSAFVPMLNAKIEFHDKDVSEDDEKDMLLEIFSEKGLSRYDPRYSMIEGCLLDIPKLPKEVIQKIYCVCEEIGEPFQASSQGSETHVIVGKSQIGELDIEWREKTYVKDNEVVTVQQSQGFETEHCRMTNHASNRKEVFFTKYDNGSVRGYCHNCQEAWWEFTTFTPRNDRDDTQFSIANFATSPLTPEQERADVERLIAQAPIGINYPPSYRHFTPEQRALVTDDGHDPYASYAPSHSGRKPIWVPQYAKLYPATGHFALNGQPPETEQHRVWNTLIQSCPTCRKTARAYWIDRFRLVSGLYCDHCHSDLQTNSFLSMELQRRLPNAYESDFAGYIADDPFLIETPLWKPGQVMFLGAAMNKGKTTLAISQGVKMAIKYEGHFIICVSRIALAKQLHAILTDKYGVDTFGLFHEGSIKTFGILGAVCTLSSLHIALGWQAPYTGETFKIENCFICIDEVDFSYDLFSLLPLLARGIKDALTDALHSRGLLVMGQTEFTASLEALGCELTSDSLFGYYNDAQPHNTPVDLFQYPDLDGKNNWASADLIQDIQAALDAGHNAYVFVHTRRLAAVLKEMFWERNPLVFTRYSKNRPRVTKFLQEGKLTDTNLFIATSVANVGINILDEKARTFIQGGLINGHLKPADMVQEAVRDRLQHPTKIYLPDFQNAIPVSPTDAKDVSLYEAEQKRTLEKLNTAEVRNAEKLAAAYALRSLAADDPETFIFHHLKTAGYQPQTKTPLPPCEIATDRVKELTKLTREQEKKEVRDIAIAVWEAESKRIKQMQETEEYLAPHLLTTWGVRNMDATEFTVLGNEKATDIAIALGFDDAEDTQRGETDDPRAFDWLPEDFDTAIALIENAVETQTLRQQMRGYLAARHETRSDDLWQDDLYSGKELSALRDYHFIGELVVLFVDNLSGKHWETPELTEHLRLLLKSERGDSTYIAEIQKGILGVSVWRKARYIHLEANDPIEFCRDLVTTFYPVVWKEHKGVHSLHNDPNLQLFSGALKSFLYHQRSEEMQALDAAFGDTFAGIKVTPIADIPTPKQLRDAEVIDIAKQGMTREDIAKKTGLSAQTIKKIAPSAKTAHQQSKAYRDAEILRLHDEGKSQREIERIMKADGVQVANGTIRNVLARNPR